MKTPLRRLSRRYFLHHGGMIAVAIGSGCNMMKQSSAHNKDVAPPVPVAVSRPPSATRVQRITPQQDPSRLVAGKGRLGQLGLDVLAVWDTQRWTLATRIPLENPRGACALADGSLAALAVPRALVGNAALHHLAADSLKPAVYTGYVPNSSLAMSRLFAAGAPRQVLVVSPNRSYNLTLHQLVEGGKLDAVGHIPLDGNEHQTMAGLGDGSVIFQTGGVLSRLVVGQAVRSYTLPADIPPILHLAPGPEPDQVWATSRDGSLRRLKLAAPVVTLDLVRPGAEMIYHMDAVAGHVAVVLVDQPAEGTRWTLAVYNAAGKERWRTPLHPVQVADYFVRVSPAFVAFGDAEQLNVWDIQSGKLLMNQPSAS